MCKSPTIKKDSREGGNKYKAKVSTLQYQAFNDTFRDRAYQFKLSYEHFIKKAPKLKEVFKNWNRHKPKEKSAYVDTFSTEKWLKLSGAKKQQHSLEQCKGCHHFFTKLQATFPVKSPQLKKFAKENPFYQAQNLPKHKPAVLNDCTRQIYNFINKPFEKTFGVSFEEAQTKLSELNVQMKPSKTERKAELRNSYRNIKNKIEAEWSKNSVER